MCLVCVQKGVCTDMSVYDLCADMKVAGLYADVSIIVCMPINVYAEVNMCDLRVR